MRDGLEQGDLLLLLAAVLEEGEREGTRFLVLRSPDTKLLAWPFYFTCRLTLSDPNFHPCRVPAERGMW